MLNKANDTSIMPETSGSVEVECKTVQCPHCKQDVPNAIYCLLCGFPLYSMKTGSQPVEAEKDEEPIPPEFIQPVEEPKTIEPEPDPAPIEAPIVEPEPVVEVVLQEQAFPPPEFYASIPEPVVVEEEATVEDVEIMVDEHEDRVGDTEDAEFSVQVSFNEPATFEQIGEDSEEMHGEYEPEPATKEMLKDLMNSISLKLWSVKLLTEGRAKEDHFTRLFKGYMERFDHCLSQRNKLLEKAQDVGVLTLKLENAKVGLGELEIRKSLGDLNRGEYDAKAPAYNCEIGHYEREIDKKNGEISYLENPGKILPHNEILNLQDLAQNNYESLDHLESNGDISVDIAEMVRLSLQKDLSFLKNLKGL